MNRHFVYSAMTDTVLGTPIRREESKSRETPWVPTDTPGYVRRTNAEGMPEVSHVDNLPKPEVAPQPQVACWRGKGVKSLWARVVGGVFQLSLDSGRTWHDDSDPPKDADAYLRACFVPVEAL